jgi:hypothetical protein
MSKKVLLIAGVVLAAGSVAAISSPYFRDGQLRLGQLLDEFGGGDPDDRPHRSGRRHREMDGDNEGRPARRSGRHFDAVDRQAGEHNEGFTRTRHGRSAMRDVDEEPRGQELSERLWRWFGGGSHDRQGAEEVDLGLGRNRRDAGESRRASSGRQADRADRRFSRLDRNSDGVIDARDFEARAAEIAAAAAQRFLERYDADGDGKVSREEFGRVAKDRPQERVADLELDGEDKMTEADRPPRQPGRGILK